MDELKRNNSVAVVFGGNINGYSVISELVSQEVPVVLVWNTFSYANLFFSKKLTKLKADYSTSEGLKSVLEQLHKVYDYLVLYPTADFEIEVLAHVYDDIAAYCFVPFNKENVLFFSNKIHQYEYCEKLGIPYPKTFFITTENDLKKVDEMDFPVIVKPSVRKDLKMSVFRNKILKTKQQWQKDKSLLENYLSQGVDFVVSEIIPGDDSNIYGYVGYRNNQGEILNEWTGRKLSQFPDEFGVFASASNEAPDVVLQQGRRLLQALNLYGINEPEFKYDYRDGNYKLMEINLRSMMWNRVGHLSGVMLQYTQWLDAHGQKIPTYKQQRQEKIHLFYLQYELINLFCRKRYWKTFWHNFKKSDKTFLAEYQNKAIGPFLYSFVITILRIIKRCIKL